MPAPGFVNDQEIMDQVRATLSIDNLDDASGWPRTCKAANRTAYGTILRALMRRGYSQAQVDSWDGGIEYQTDIALWYAIVRGGLAKDYDPKYLSLFDRRAELATAMVTAGGVLLIPATPATSSGQLTTTTDLFSLGDDDMQEWYESLEGPTVPPNPRS